MKRYPFIIECIFGIALLIVALNPYALDIQGEEMAEIVQAENQSDQFIDSLYSTLSLEEKVGQLFMIRAHSNLGPDHVKEVSYLVDHFKVGGLCFFQGTPEKQVELILKYQSISEIPLLIATDAEWGTGMRFKASGFSFPKQLTLGAIENDRLIYEMGKEVAVQLKESGVHMNFAPVVDINNNPANPVINDRSFGEDRLRVSRKGDLYMQGMQDGGILACAKHFPGHGDTDTDSHFDLPVIPYSKERLDSLELFPFRVLSQQKVAAMMIAHLNLPALDDKENLPSSLSELLITDILRNEIGFDGLIITDGMEMEGVTKYYPPGVAEAEAFKAGNDIILLPRDLKKAVEAVISYIEDGKISIKSLEESVKRIISAKARLGLFTKSKKSVEEMPFKPYSELDALALKEELIREAITLVKDDGRLIPLKLVKGMKIASLTDQSGGESRFEERLSNYGPFDHYRMDEDYDALLEELAKYHFVVLGLMNTSKYASRGFGLQEEEVAFIEKLATKTRLILCHFGSPYALSKIKGVDHILCAYENGEMFQDLTAQALFGVFSLSGTLPVSVDSGLKLGQGIRTPQLFKLGFSRPESNGMNSEVLSGIDSLAEEMIADGATPGCQILITKNGNVVFQKSFGNYTYKEILPVTNNSIYDLASLTKVLATTLGVMDLFDRGDISVFRPIGYYLEELRESDKASLVIEDIMTHHARLWPWIPFYKDVLTEDKVPKPDPLWFSTEMVEPYTIEVAEDMYMNRVYLDSMWQKIEDSELRSNSKYRYSDLGFYLLSKLIERKSGLTLDDYVQKNFYGPMGLHSISYNPLETFEKSEIIPSEEDEYFRFQKIHGHVHDMGAAMMGGVSGHAGLFSNAWDVAQIMQMLLNGGFYGGERFFRPETVAFFTARPDYESRRALGFDMKQLDRKANPNMSEKASFRTFGHLGFTGTAAWADPTHNLVFVFLSNRTYPSMDNRKLIREDYRIHFQDIAYKAIIK